MAGPFSRYVPLSVVRQVDARLARCRQVRRFGDELHCSNQAAVYRKACTSGGKMRAWHSDSLVWIRGNRACDCNRALPVR